MTKLNNKGQTLALFILLIPFLLLLLGVGVDLGLKSIQKRKTDKVISYAISYGLKNIDKENIKTDIEDLINKNLDNIIYTNIQIEERIEIEVQISFKSVFENLFTNKVKTYKVKYKGYLEDGKIKIVRG